jgi:hypothetical protein
MRLSLYNGDNEPRSYDVTVEEAYQDTPPEIIKKDTQADTIWNRNAPATWTGRLPNTDPSSAPAYTIRPESSSRGGFFRDVSMQGEARTQEY